MFIWFSFCIWGFVDGYNMFCNFYYGIVFGCVIMNVFWFVFGNDVIMFNKYDFYFEFKKIKFWSYFMFIVLFFFIYNYFISFWDFLIKGIVKVYIVDIIGLFYKMVYLFNGIDFLVDVLCCVIGWKYVLLVKFFFEGIDLDIGLFYILSKVKLFIKEVVERVDKEIFGKFLWLKD